MNKSEKYRAWFGLDRAVMAAMVIMLCFAFPVSAARSQTAPASQQTVTLTMNSAPDDVGWQQNMNSSVKDNMNYGYEVDKVDVNFQVVNKVNNSGLLASVIDDHPRCVYAPYTYTLEMNPFKIEEELEMCQLASAMERSEAPSICYGKPRMNFNANAKLTGNANRWPLMATLVLRE